MIIVISGPSGSGKSTLAGLFEVKGFKRIVTSTNRDRRLNDPEGQYYFVPKKEWNDDDYICVTNYGGNKYGIDKGYFDEINKDLNYIVVLDEAGLKELKEYYDNVYGFYLNVVEKTCRERMAQRGDATDNIEKRIAYDKEHHRFNYLIDDDDLYDQAFFGEDHPSMIMRQIMDYFNNNPDSEETIDEGEEILAMLHKQK